MDLDLAAACELAALQPGRARKDGALTGVPAAAAALRAGVAAALDGLTAHALQSWAECETLQVLPRPAPTQCFLRMAPISSLSARLDLGPVCCDVRLKWSLHIASAGHMAGAGQARLSDSCPDIPALCCVQEAASVPGLAWGVYAIRSVGTGPLRIAWPELSVAADFAACPSADGFAVCVQQLEAGRRDCARGCPSPPSAVGRQQLEQEKSVGRLHRQCSLHSTTTM